MNKVYKLILLFSCTALFLISCDEDRDSNPILPEQSTLTMQLNNPEMQNTIVDLANCEKIVLTTSQPDYGFPAATEYSTEMSINEDMTDAITLSTISPTPRIELLGNEIASQMTNLELAAGKTEADFPLNAKLYFRVKAGIKTPNGLIEESEVTSNIVALNVRLEFSLPAIELPSNLYITGEFNNWDWGSSLAMVPVYGTDNVFWHMVYIGEQGIKFNQAQAWDGNEIGFEGIKNISGESAGDIVNGGGNIASSQPGWYLMIVTASIEGRNIVYDVAFEAPNVYLTGMCIGNIWDELNPAGLFTAPETPDGDFISPAFTMACPGDKDGVRAYVKIPGYDWWMSEFIVGLDGKKISYRGKGGDQERVPGAIGQRLYLNFTSETGEIK